MHICMCIIYIYPPKKIEILKKKKYIYIYIFRNQKPENIIFPEYFMILVGFDNILLF